MEACIKNKSEPSPIEITVLERMVNGKKVKVSVWEKDPGVSLLGPAALNEIWVKDGNILGINELIKIDADHAADCFQFGQNKKFGQLKFAGPRLLND